MKDENQNQNEKDNEKNNDKNENKNQMKQNMKQIINQNPTEKKHENMKNIDISPGTWGFADFGHFLLSHQ